MTWALNVAVGLVSFSALLSAISAIAAFVLHPRLHGRIVIEEGVDRHEFRDVELEDLQKIIEELEDRREKVPGRARPES